MFQDTGVFGASASQLLDLGVSEFCLCSQIHSDRPIWKLNISL